MMKVVITLMLSTICCFARNSSDALSDGDYLITIPRVFRVGVTQNIAINIFGNRSCDVEVALYDSIKTGIQSKTEGRFHPNQAGVLQLQVPQGLYKPEVTAKVCGARSVKKTVSYETPAKKIFIQTDKPIYKPGQKVLMRIIYVDSQLKPAKSRISLVNIKEPNGVKIMQWRNIELQDGIANLHLQLSKEPVIGKWSITVTVQGLTVTKQIEISKYVLPKFQLDVKPPTYFAWFQHEIPVSVCARYTYGKFVTGRVEATLCLQNKNSKQNCLTELRNVTECLEIDARELLETLTEFKNGYYLHIDVKFTETSTGIKLTETARSAEMVKYCQTVSFVGVPKEFKPGLPMKFKIKVAYLDGEPVTGGIIELAITNGYTHRQKYLVRNGWVVVHLNNVPLHAKILDFKAIYNPGNLVISKKSTALYSPSFSYLKLVIPDRGSKKVGSQGSVTVMYNVYDNIVGKTISFQHQIICRGSLVLSGLIKRRPNRRRNKKSVQGTTVNGFKFIFNISQEMVPRCRILVYYVRQNKEVVGDSVVYNVEDKFENQVSVNFIDEQKRPGEKTKIVMKAKPGSRVALAALDKSVLLLRDDEEVTKSEALGFLNLQDVGPMSATHYNLKCSEDRMPLETDVSQTFNNAGLIILSNLKIFTKPCGPPEYEYVYEYRIRYERRRLGPRRYVGRRREIVIAKRIRRPKPVENTEKRPIKASPVVKVRKNFPETWFWTEFKLNETSETKTVEVKVPDTITSWVASGFALSSVHGMGIANEAVLKVFQPFFVKMILPYSVVRGEEIPVTVTVFNYLSSCAPIKLVLNRDSKDYKITSFHISKICVCGDSGASVKFRIIPKKVGHIALEVKAVTSQAKLCPNSTVYVADAVSRKLLVEPEGIKQEHSQGSFFCSTNRGIYNETLNMVLPTKIVPESLVQKIYVTGDVMGPALTNLDGLLTMPYGCGEQNMAKFAPNIYIMDYLTQTNQVTEKIRDNAFYFMKSGYQRQLRYKRQSGSYSIWGNTDKKGSMMLTAFVVRSLARARKYVFIDQREIENSVQWFKRKQKPSGCFPNYGQVFDRSLQGGLNSEITITAYVTIALLEAGYTNKTTMVSSALECIIDNLHRSHDSYTTCLITYVLALADHPKAEFMVQRLKKKAVTSKDGQIFWSARNDKHASTEKQTVYHNYLHSPADVEMTGYALMTYLKRNELIKDVSKIVKWLSKRRNQFGGFLSTQDTCVAIQALSEAAKKWYHEGGWMNMTVSASVGNVVQEFSITDSNKLVLQRAVLPNNLPPTIRVLINATGEGCALLQTSLKYNIPVPQEAPAFKVDVSVQRREAADEEEITACYPLRLTINAKWLKKGVSNMAIVDVKLVSGFSVNEKALQAKLNGSKSIDFTAHNSSNSEAILKRYEIDGQNVILYFDEIKSMRFTLDIIQSTLIKKTKPGVVRIYDYYEPGDQAKTMYVITDEDCYGERIKKECPKCLSVDDFDALFDNNINCTSYLRRVKSLRGFMNVKKGYIKANKNQIHTGLSYEIPEFCTCEEIYNGVTSLVFGQSDYLRKDGKKATIVFDATTTIAKWNGKKMRKVFKEKMRQKIYQRCRRLI